MLRLVAYAPDGVRRFPIRRDELVIGSEPECDIHLPYSGVAQEHARVVHQGSALWIQDLGSRKGVLVSGEKIKESALEVLDEIRIGSVTLLVEDAVTEEEESQTEEEPEPLEAHITAESMLDHISRISQWVVSDVESRTTLESLVSRVLRDFGGGVLLLLQGRPADVEQSGLKLVVSTDSSWLGAGESIVEQLKPHIPDGAWPSRGMDFAGELAEHEAWICVHAFEVVQRSYVMLVALPRFSPDDWHPGSALKALGDLVILGLVHHVGSYEPILPGQSWQQGLTLAPELVVGPSEAMDLVLEKLKSAVEADIHVLLRGERGSGKQLLAKSLHLSGPRRRGPFIAASGEGASPNQIEASLFGAEVAGKDKPVRREGKLSLADGGTLFLDDVDRLPLELQARLVRFLRSGDVEPAGSRDARTVDVRLIAGCRGPLDLAVAKDLFRVDLAYRLSQFAVDVPPLRERREDLPLLIQSLVNTFCHETGKRMRGITVKAMSALLSYDYPGNLSELENIVRQLVYTCPSDQPIDVSHLPEEVRLSKIQSKGRVDESTSELDLDRLVAATEAAAIREALRRTQGNKSQAAKALGLSRNGLTMKMERYGLTA